MKKILLTGLTALTFGCAAQFKEINLEKILIVPLNDVIVMELDTDKDGRGDHRYFYKAIPTEQGIYGELIGYCVDKNKDGKYTKDECVKINKGEEI